MSLGSGTTLGPIPVAPYNAQVDALRERLPDARIGTVDKFQGQEAPVVIFSTATSSVVASWGELQSSGPGVDHDWYPGE